jgi:hypothetical protein
MRFKNLFRIFFGLAVLSVTLDYLVTVLGFNRHIVFAEVNPHILFAMRFVDRYLAASIVFFATLGFVLASYWAVGRLFQKPPYDGGLKKVWRHLWYGSPTRRDLVIFALIALYLYFTYIHLWGAKTWIDLFRIHGF